MSIRGDHPQGIKAICQLLRPMQCEKKFFGSVHVLSLKKYAYAYEYFISIKAPITTAAEDSLEYFFIVFSEKRRQYFM